MVKGPHLYNALLVSLTTQSTLHYMAALIHLHIHVLVAGTTHKYGARKVGGHFEPVL